MVPLNDVADAALNRDSLRLRGLTQTLIRESPRLSDVPRPVTSDDRHLVTAAAIVELLAARTGQPAPAWTAKVGGLSEPFFLVVEAETMTHLRTMCEQESPEPLRKRRLLAPPEFLSWA